MAIIHNFLAIYRPNNYTFNKTLMFWDWVFSFGFVVFQVKDDGLVNDEKKDEEETSQKAENEESIIGTVETI